MGKNDKLLFFSLAVFFCGVFLLVFLSSSLAPRPAKISDLSVYSVGDYVLVRGVVDDVFVSSSAVFLTLSEGESSIDCVFFPSTVDRLRSVGFDVLDLRKGDVVSVAGRVALYEGELEIVVENTGEVYFA